MLPADESGTAACLARLVNDFSAAIASRALPDRLRHPERCTLLCHFLPAAVAVGADFRRCSRLAAGTGAVGAHLNDRHGDFLFTAECSFFKADIQSGSGVAAFSRRVRIRASRGAAEASEAAAEYISEAAEQITQITEVKSAESTAAEPGVRIKCGMTVLVVLFALFLIGKNFVCLVRFLETFLAGFIPGV